MRREVVSKLVLGYDVCLFCAFRPAFGLFTHPAKKQHTRRNYGSSTFLQSHADASVAHQRDQEEDESPMLKQNSRLANAFPRRQLSTRPPSVTRPQARSPEDLPSIINDDKARSPFRNNFDSFARRSSNSIPGRTRHDQFSGRKSHESQFSIDRNQKFDKHVRGPAGGRGQVQQRSSIDQDPTNEQVKTTRFRFIPIQHNHDTDSKATVFTRTTSQNLDHDRRSFSHPVKIPDQQRQSGFRHQPQANHQISSSNPPKHERNELVRQVSFEPFAASTSTTNTRRSQRNDKERHLFIREKGSQNTAATNRTETEVRFGERVEAPAGMSFDPTDDDYRPGHRRGHREDKRTPRSSRFEDETEVSSSTATSATYSRRGRSSMRASDFDYEMAEAEEALYGDRSRKSKKTKSQKAPETVKSRPRVSIPEFMSVGQLASAISVPLESFKLKLEEEGYEGARYDHILDAQTASMFADLYGYEPIIASEDEGIDLVARPPPEDVSSLPPRPPIVTIMGHVDHGKTTILDYLRKSSVVASEHGGITQHIGAFSVTMPGTNRQITFLDTPGHAAFLEMRRRGANVTDIVVLVVAADDSVKPQTIEAIKHAIDAKVQIIVAINKVDKEDADVERVKQDLSRHEIVVEDYGGDFQAIPVSGKTGRGMEDLEEAIITLADVSDFRAERDGLAEGTIIESKVTAAGRVATVLVRRGTIRVGDCIVAGTTWARVRTLRDDTGHLVTEATPGMPVQVDGWRGEDPSAGLEVLQAEDEQQAKDAVDFRVEKRETLRTTTDLTAINEARSEEADARAKVLAWEAEQAWSKMTYGRRPKDNAGWVEPDAMGGPERVHFVVKADVAGSVEAVAAAVSAVGNNEIVANVIHSGTGQVTESDITMLGATGETGYVISFNQGIDGAMYRLAETAGLGILDHNIIYKVTDSVKDILAEQLSPLVTQKVVGEADIGQIFDVTVKKNKIKIAGCKVTNGTISRAHKVRVLRNGSVIYTGNLHSLKNVKKDVTEMRKGTECGMGFEDWDDFQEGDQVQCFEEHKEKRTLY